MKRGFTLIEVLIVIAVIVILVSMSTGAFVQFYAGNILESETQKVQTILVDARAQTLLSKEDTNYGVHFESNKVILFKGNTYSAVDPDNEELILSSRVSLTTNIVGGGSDIIYRRLTGNVVANGTTTISLVSDSNRFIDLVIEKTGIVE